MKMKVLRFGMALCIVWTLIVFGIGILNLINVGYGSHFLKLIDSIYPGYHYGQWGFWGVLVASLYAAVEAFLVGIIFAWIYNFIGKNKTG